MWWSWNGLREALCERGNPAHWAFSASSRGGREGKVGAPVWDGAPMKENSQNGSLGRCFVPGR